MKNKYELYHHGILGQRWGKKNGPPYPLGVSDHSASEKKAGWKKSLGKSSSVDTKQKKSYTSKEKKGLTSEQKKTLMKIGAAVAVAGLAAYGGYKLYQNGALDSIILNGKKSIEGIQGANIDLAKLKENGLEYRSDMTANTIDGVKAALAGNNPSGNTHNCVGTVGNWALRMMGINAETVASERGIDPSVLQSVFKGLTFHPVGDGIKDFRDVKSAVDYACDEIKNKYPEGSFGYLASNSRVLGRSGHAIGWKKLDGNILLCDTQYGFIYDSVNHFSDFLKKTRLDPLGFEYGCLSECEVDLSKIHSISK